MKTEEEVYKEIEDYINGSAHNRPCTLSSIKKIFRTQRIIDLIFSRPDIFRLDVEFQYVPIEQRSEKLLLKFVLGNPKRLSLFDENGSLPVKIAEEEQTLPVLVAFEFSKRRYERISARQWGQWGEKIPYTGKNKIYLDTIRMCCDSISKEVGKDVETFPIDEIVDIIQQYFSSKTIELKAGEEYERKYNKVNFDLEKRLFILISGMPDSGKTTFSRLLSDTIKGSTCFDSDMLIEHELLDAPLSSLIRDTDGIIIFSDIDADCFFSKEEMGDSTIINIIVNPSSIEEMHRHSKYMRSIPFDEYKSHEIDKYNFDRIINPIIVQNDYTNKIYMEVDRAIEEIAKRLGIQILVNPKVKSIK